MAPLSLKLHEETSEDEKKTHIGRRNIHKILKWINLLIKERVEKVFHPSETGFSFSIS